MSGRDIKLKLRKLMSKCSDNKTELRERIEPMILRKKLIKLASIAHKHIGRDNARLLISAIEYKLIGEKGSVVKNHNLSKIEQFLDEIDIEEFDDVWNMSDMPGWLYQYYLAPELDIFRSQSAPKVQSHQIAMRTHQCTPRWIAEFLVQNTLGRYWLEMHPDSKLADYMPYFIPAENISVRQMKLSGQIKILDPACGAMPFGLAVFDLLEQIYREEMQNAGKRGWPDTPTVKSEDDICDSIIANNLFGIDIDPLAKKLSRLSFAIRTKNSLTRELNILIANTLDKNLFVKLKRSKFPQQFDIVLLNPPYLDKRDYNSELKLFMRRHYGRAGRNLYSAFVMCASQLLSDDGLMGAITPQTFMFIKSYKSFREFLLRNLSLELLVHTGLNTFADAVVDCAFYVMRKRLHNGNDERKSCFIRLTDMSCPEEKHAGLKEAVKRMKGKRKAKIIDKNIYKVNTKAFSSLPGNVWVYWISDNIRRLFCDLGTLGDIAEIRQGLATTDNKRFVRFFWEIPYSQICADCENLQQAKRSGRKWFLYMKGGNYCKWFGNRRLVVNWENDGREIKSEIIRRYPYLNGKWEWVAKNSEYYFREGITYSYLTSGKFSARYMPKGSIFDVAGSAIFTRNRRELYAILGILNSSLSRYLLSLINYTVNFQIGDLQNLPIPENLNSAELIQFVEKAITLRRQLESFEETSFDFVIPPDWPDGIDRIRGIYRSLNLLQRKIDESVFELYGIAKADIRRICSVIDTEDEFTELSRDELAYRWVSYAVGLVFGRFDVSANMCLSSHIARNDIDNFKRKYINYRYVNYKSDDMSGLNIANLANIVNDILQAMLGDKAVKFLKDCLNGSGDLERYLEKEFFVRHYHHYQHRPVYWLVKKRDELYCYFYHNLADIFELDDGILANLKKVCPDLRVSRNPFPIDSNLLFR